MGHVVRRARGFGSQLGFSVRSATVRIGEFSGGAADGAPGSDLVQSLWSAVRAFATSGHSQLVLRPETWNERLEFSRGVCFGARDSELSSPLGFGFGASASFSRQFLSNSYGALSDMQATTTDGLGFHQRHALVALQRSVVRGDRGFAKAVALPPQMQKRMKLCVYMGSPGVIGEPWKPLSPPLPFLNGTYYMHCIWGQMVYKEGWKIRKQNVQDMLKTGFTLAKIRQKAEGYSQTKFYRMPCRNQR